MTDIDNTEGGQGAVLLREEGPDGIDFSEWIANFKHYEEWIDCFGNDQDGNSGLGPVYGLSSDDSTGYGDGIGDTVDGDGYPREGWEIDQDMKKIEPLVVLAMGVGK